MTQTPQSYDIHKEVNTIVAAADPYTLALGERCIDVTSIAFLDFTQPSHCRMGLQVLGDDYQEIVEYQQGTTEYMTLRAWAEGMRRSAEQQQPKKRKKYASFCHRCWNFVEFCKCPKDLDEAYS